MVYGQLDQSYILYESRICIDQRDDVGNFFWCHSNEICKDDCPKKTSKFSKLFIIWGCRLFKGPEEIAIIASTISVHMYNEILENFLISLIENWFGNDEVIIQDNNASCH